MLDLFEGDFGPRETLKFIEDKLGAGIWRWDIASGDMQWSRGFFALIGLEFGAINPSFSTLQQMIHPEDRFAGDELSEFLRAGTPLEREFRVIRQNGRVRWISSRIEALFDMAGRVTRAIGVSYDMTKQREQLQHQKSLTARFDALLASISSAVCLVDKAGTVVRTLRSNDKAQPPSENWVDSVYPDDRADVERRLANSRTQLVRQDLEHRVHRSNNAPAWVRTVAMPIHDEHKLQQEWLYVTTDIDLERRYCPVVSDHLPRLTGAQIRASRGILAMSVKDLADTAQVSPSTIRRFEEIDGPNALEPALTKIQTALTEKGIEFIFPRGGEPSARLHVKGK